MSEKKVIISITGTQRLTEGEPDTVELVTDGTYSYSDAETVFSYMESSLTGLEGTRTSFIISPMHVVLSREGRLNSRMVFEAGKKHHFLYETPYGTATMGVDTHTISHRLGEHGGDMEIDYVVDFDHAVVGYNYFKINVREAGPSAQ